MHYVAKKMAGYSRLGDKNLKPDEANQFARSYNNRNTGKGHLDNIMKQDGTNYQVLALQKEAQQKLNKTKRGNMSIRSGLLF